MVMYSISSKLNSAFSTIGKATVKKIIAKLIGKNSCFRFYVNIKLIRTCGHAANHGCEIWTIFVLLNKCFASSWMKSYCYWTTCHVSVIWLPLFGNLKVNSFFDARFLHIRCGYTGHLLTWEIALLPCETAFSSVTDVSRGKFPVLYIHGYVKKITWHF